MLKSGWVACRDIRHAGRILELQAAEWAKLPGAGRETPRSQRSGVSARVGQCRIRIPIIFITVTGTFR